jgi:hypothetical protein
MAQVTFPRRVTSTPTTIIVSGLPSWLPTAGSWGAVSTKTAESIKGNFPYFTSARDWSGVNGLWSDYSGAVWNPHIGTYGAMLFHGGGHASSIGMLDNGVYMWRADTREWSRLVDPTYPGDLGANDWVYPRNPPYDSALLNTYGEVATNVPASNHSRWYPCILPPGNGGGAYGSLILPGLASIHTGDAGTTGQAHKLDCQAAITATSANANSAWSRIGPVGATNLRSWAGCVDSTQGYIYSSNSDYPAQAQLLRLNINTLTWSDASPSGWTSWRGQPIQFVSEHNMLIVMNSSFGLAVMNAAGAPLSLVTVTTSGTPPTGGAPSSGQGGGFVWCPDLGSYGAVVHHNYTNNVVKACYAPANPLSGTGWSWATLSSSNSPSGLGNPNHFYNRFQYAPALKSFFLCSIPNDSYGGIACFRPSEII